MFIRAWPFSVSVLGLQLQMQTAGMFVLDAIFIVQYYASK